MIDNDDDLRTAQKHMAKVAFDLVRMFGPMTAVSIDAMLPEALDRVLEREVRQRRRVAALLAADKATINFQRNDPPSAA